MAYGGMLSPERDRISGQREAAIGRGIPLYLGEAFGSWLEKRSAAGWRSVRQPAGEAFGSGWRSVRQKTGAECAALGRGSTPYYIGIISGTPVVLPTVPGKVGPAVTLPAARSAYRQRGRHTGAVRSRPPCAARAAKACPGSSVPLRQSSNITPPSSTAPPPSSNSTPPPSSSLSPPPSPSGFSSGRFCNGSSRV